MFNPGETVTHQFTIPFIATELREVLITYKQNNNVFLKKTITSGFEEKTSSTTLITFAMTQEESLLFKEDMNYKIQINVLTTQGSRFSSKEMAGQTGIQHYKEVIRNGS